MAYLVLVKRKPVEKSVFRKTGLAKHQIPPNVNLVIEQKIRITRNIQSYLYHVRHEMKTI